MSEGIRTVERCPACNGASAPRVGLPASGFDTVIGGRHFYQPPYAVNACGTCGLYFKTMTLAPALLDAYYAALDWKPFEVDGNFPTDRVLHERLGRLPSGSRVLDFGCSTGRILKHLTARLTCVGVEPNEPAADVARQRGIEIIPPGVVADTPPFDAILMADVFEHLIDPMPLLKTLAGRLSPGGWLAIVTGNADAIAPRTRLAEFWYFRLPGHVLMLSERHLAWLAPQLGLRVDEVRRCSHYDVGWRERLRQRAQAFAYDVFRSSPQGLTAGLLRWVPRLSNAAAWPTAPAIDYRADHVVAFLTRPNR